MLKKNQRLTTKQINFVFGGGKSVYGEDLSLIFKKQEGEKKNNQYAISVSSKATKTAVERNYLRRTGYGFLEKNKNIIKTPFLCVFIIKKRQTKKDKAMVEKKMETLLYKAGLI